MTILAESLDATTLITQTGIAGAAVIIMLAMLKNFATVQEELRTADQKRLDEFVTSMRFVADQNSKTAGTLQSTVNVLLDLSHQSREMLQDIRDIKADP